MSDTTENWVGESGAAYGFYVFGFEPQIPRRDGLYVYARKNEDDMWVPIYIGQGDLLVRCTKDKALMKRIKAKGGTHVHLRLNSNADDREFEVADLLKRYVNAFEPKGCHLPARPPEDDGAETLQPAAIVKSKPAKKKAAKKSSPAA